MDKELIQYVKVEVCINIKPRTAPPTFGGLEQCDAAVYDKNQAAYITNIDFLF
jgi:hypothetical protein